MYLWVLVSETASLNVEGVATRLRPSVEQVVLPLDAAKGVKMAMGPTNSIAGDDHIHLGCCPQGVLQGRDVQLVTKVGADPLCKFGLQT